MVLGLDLTCFSQIPLTYAQKKRPVQRTGLRKKRQRPTLPLGIAVPSAQMSLTSLFGMEKGDPHRNSHLKLTHTSELVCNNTTYQDIIADTQ
jgi:hypothetical protein